MTIWFGILSDLFVNIAAAWFAVVFIEPQLNPISTLEEFSFLMYKLVIGIISLYLAKCLKENSL